MEDEEKVYSELEIIANTTKLKYIEKEMFKYINHLLPIDSDIEKVYTEYLVLLRHRGVDCNKNRANEQVFMTFMADYFKNKLKTYSSNTSSNSKSPSS